MQVDEIVNQRSGKLPRWPSHDGSLTDSTWLQDRDVMEIFHKELEFCDGVSYAGVWHFCEFEKIFLGGFDLLGLVLDLKLRLDFDFVLGFGIFMNLSFFFFFRFWFVGFGFGFEAEIGGCGWLRWWLKNG